MHQNVKKCLFFWFIIVFFSLHSLAQPTITSVSPGSGPVGTTVTIGGSNFSTTPSNNIVYFGAVRANVMMATSTFLTVTVPAGTTYQPITVTVNNLTGYSAKPFIVTFLGAAIQFNSQSFENEAHIDSVDSNTETTKYTIGDINNDGKIDVITVDRLNNTISVYRNSTTSGQISFASKVEFATAQSPRAVAVADIDGDGKLDAIVTNLKSNTVSIFRNISSGSAISFASRFDFVTATQPSGISVTDLDKDGKPDLVVNTINLEGYVSVLRNTTSGSTISFASKIDLQSNGGSIENISTGDLDGDGKTDIAVPNYGLHSTSIFRNTSPVGSISFAAKLDIATGQYPDQLQIADLNDDGKLDLAVSYYLSNDNVSIFKNTSSAGSISFATAVNYPTGSATDGIAINDLDGDGKADMAVCGIFDSVSLFKNTSASFGAISFAPISKFATVWDGPILTGDFDNDSKPDISLHGGLFRVIIRKNRTTEPQITSFTPTSGGPGTTITITGQKLSGVTSVSFGGVAANSFTVVNNTTITAVVGAGASGDVTVTASYGTAKLNGFIFTSPPIINSFTPTTGLSGVTITISGNNFLRATAVTFGGVPAAAYTVVNATTITAVVGAGASGNVSVTTPSGTAIFGGFTYIPKPHVISFTPTTGTIGTAVTITGTDLTGATDVRFGGIPAGSFTVISSTTISATVLGGSSGNVKVTTPGGSDSLNGFIFIQPPSPVITSFTPTTGAVGTVVTIVGNNFDTNPSLNYVYFGPARATVSSASANSLTVTVPYGATYNSISVTTNFLTAYSNTRFIVTFPDGGNVSSNSFEGPYSFTASTSPEDVCISDVDGDGKNDLISANDFSSTISVLRNNSTNGSISFASKVDFYSNYDTWRVLSSEIDGDGKKDIVAINHGDKKITVLKNTSIAGSISFAPYWSYPLTQEPWDIAVADFNSDGKTDFAVVSYYSLSVIRNTSVVNNFSLAPKIDFITPSATVAVATGDLDHDDKPDIVYLDNSGDSIYIMRNTSNGGILSFASPIGYPTKSDYLYYGPTDVTIGDMDNDNKPEIIVANTLASRSISIFKNNSVRGVISFPDRIDILTGNIQPCNLSLDDIDGDSKPDIAFTHEYVPRTISVVKNISTTGSIAFAEHVDFTDNGNSQLGSGICTGDLDGDGRPEIIASGGNTVGNFVYVYKNKTNGPHITTFTPANGIAGQSITITGLNFANITEVKFGGVSAISFKVNSPTSITAVLSSGASGNVTVANAIGIASAKGFLYGLAPTITSFTPKSGVTGAIITITGTNFTGATAVTFGGLLATSYTVVSPTTITATVGLGASGNVSVMVPGGTASLQGFTYIPPAPVINSFAPQNGSEGTLVTISGSNFTGVTSVSFGGVPASSFTVVGPSLITASVSVGATGSVAVTTSGGTGSKAGFTFIQAAPTVISYTPTGAATGATITITGTNFTGATAVSFGGIAATSFTVVSPTTITAVVGTGASGNVSVTTPGGIATKTGFTFISAPVITSFTPTNAGAGTTVTLTGNNFTGATSVSFGGIPATSFTVNSPTSLTAVVATGASGNVSVTTLGGTATLAGFTFIPAPTINSFSPTSANAGTTVTINGTNFTGATAVSFGGTPATSFTVVNATTITAVVGNGGSGDVSVTTQGGSASLPGFTFNFPTGLPGISGISNTLVIYPNPSKNIIVVDHPVTPKLSSILIIDMYGRLIKKFSIPRNERKSPLNIYTLSSGVYRIIWSDEKNTAGGLFFKD